MSISKKWISFGAAAMMVLTPPSASAQTVTSPSSVPSNSSGIDPIDAGIAQGRAELAEQAARHAAEQKQELEASRLISKYAQEYLVPALDKLKDSGLGFDYALVNGGIKTNIPDGYVGVKKRFISIYIDLDEAQKISVAVGAAGHLGDRINDITGLPAVLKFVASRAMIKTDEMKYNNQSCAEYDNQSLPRSYPDNEQYVFCDYMPH